MKILILGSEGQLGRELLKLYPESYGTSHNPSKSNYLPIEQKGAVVNLIERKKPRVVINSAAITNVDRCEKEKNYAYSVNGLSVKYILKACQNIDAKLVHISTDYIFDGNEGNYAEDAHPNPINYYGLSKLIGETYANSCEGNLVIRTSGVFGYSNNFPLFAYRKLKNREVVNAIKGFYSPIHAKNLALAIKELIDKGEEGIVNVAGERVSRTQIAVTIAEYFGLDKSLVKESDQVPLLQAKRPFDSSLNIDKAKNLIDFDFYSLKTNLDAFQSSIKETGII
ncbi:MAG: NAD(P)-dependent oxidoreductase [Candidatus Micrarchaeaceae archaeon]